MQNGIVHVKTGAMLLVMAMVFLFAAGSASIRPTTDEPQEGGADLIVIDALKALGPLERPPVVFFHSRHTQALSKTGRDCSTCHPADEKGRLSPRFKRLVTDDRQAVSDLYHVNCISCHREFTVAGKKSGPQSCGECHREKPAAVSTRTPIPFSGSLHYRHVKATEEKCESCHHEYDPKAQKLVAAKGKEGACAYCHKEVPVENTMAMRDAAHYQCIGCHRERVAKNQKAGPEDCLGCHDADHRLAIEVVEDVPRLKRDQPDRVLVKTGEEPLPKDQRAAAMEPVPFDHLAHETYNVSCKVCHHASLEACSSCHTIGGKKEGQNVKLAQAMHVATSQISCIGCHRKQQKAAECAGCHNFLATASKPKEKSCRACHMVPLPGHVDPADSRETVDFAEDLLRSRNLKSQTFTARQIPETVTIGRLADRFEAAAFPHGKVVQALIDKTQSSKLAGYFHDEKGTLCQGCHHNSPPTQKPPACSSCHGNTVEGSDAFRPGLVGAYHQQCIGCHNAMGIEKPAARDCNACHVEKKG